MEKSDESNHAGENLLQNTSLGNVISDPNKDHFHNEFYSISLFNKIPKD